MDVIRRFKFWIALGLPAVVSGAVFGFWFLPTKSRNNEDMADWKNKMDTVTTVEIGKLPTEGDVQEAQKVKRAYDRQSKEVQALFTGRSEVLERRIPDPDTDEETDLEPGPWKEVHGRAMTALEQETRKSFAVVNQAELVKRQTFGREWPSQDEMTSEARSYWLQRSLLEALAEVNQGRMVVPVLVSFSLVSEPDRLLHPSDGSQFRPIAFEYSIATEFEDIPYVIEQMLKCRLPLSITSLAIARRSEAAFAAGSAGPLGARPAARLSPAPATRPAAGAPAGGVRTGPPAGIRMGPPAGVRMGPPGGIRRGPSTAGGRSPAAPGGARVAAGSARPAAAARAESRTLVNVTIRGYVLEYVAPQGGQK